MRILGAILLCCLSVLPSSAASISLTVSGTDFEGGPAFLLEADSYPVGTAILPDTDANYLYSYTIDDDVLEAATVIRVRFLNDRYVEGVGDRNLLVLSLVVNGRAFSGDALSTFLRDEPSPSPGNLPSAGYEVRITRPAEGWPKR